MRELLSSAQSLLEADADVESTPAFRGDHLAHGSRAGVRCVTGAEVRALSHEGMEIFSLPFVGVTSPHPFPPFVLGHSADYERRCILGPSFRRALTGSPTMSISLKRTNLPERLFGYEDHH